MVRSCYAICIVFIALPILISASNELVMVHVVYRHGARAPVQDFLSAESAEHFYRGIGSLSDTGIRESRQLGAVLRNRYVNSSFLDSRLLPNEILFRSSAVDRVLMSAALVGQEMFAVPPAIHSVPLEDDLFLYDRNIHCPVIVNEMIKTYDISRNYTDRYKDRKINGVIDGVLAKVMSNASRLDAERLELIDTLLVENNDGLAVPSWFDEEAEGEARMAFFHVISLLAGSGPYKNEKWLRVNAGQLFHEIANLMRRRIDCEKKNNGNSIDKDKDKKQTNDCAALRKFYTYGTHDIKMAGFVDIIGASEAAFGVGGFPESGSSVILELWMIDGKPKIKLLGRRHPQMEDFSVLTYAIQSCDPYNDLCDANILLDNFKEYETSDPSKECYGTGPDFSMNALTWIFLGTTVFLLLFLIFSVLILVRCSR